MRNLIEDYLTKQESHKWLLFSDPTENKNEVQHKNNLSCTH